MIKTVKKIQPKKIILKKIAPISMRKNKITPAIDYKLYKTYEEWVEDHNRKHTDIRFVYELLRSFDKLGFIVSRPNSIIDIAEFDNDEHIKKFDENIKIYRKTKSDKNRWIMRPVATLYVRYEPLGDDTVGMISEENPKKLSRFHVGTVYHDLRPVVYDIIVYGGGDGDDKEVYAILDRRGKPILWTSNFENFSEVEPKYKLDYDDVNTDGAFLLKKSTRQNNQTTQKPKKVVRKR